MLRPGEIISILHNLGDYFAIPSQFDLVSRETLINRKIQFIKSNVSSAAFEVKHATGMFVLRH